MYNHRQNKLKTLLIYCHCLFSSMHLFVNLAELKRLETGSVEIW